MPRGAETVVVRRPAETDWQGDPIGPAPSGITVEGCILWPQSTSETNDGGIIVLETLGVYMPPDTPAVPTAEDEIEARGSTYEVVGAVGHYLNKRLADKGYLFTIRKLGVKA